MPPVPCIGGVVVGSVVVAGAVVLAGVVDAGVVVLVGVVVPGIAGTVVADAVVGLPNPCCKPAAKELVAGFVAPAFAVSVASS